LQKQGCFTGGFLANFDDGIDNRTILDRVPNLTLFTASSSNRTSFGCAAGDKMTEFGKAYLDALEQNAGTPDKMNWKKLYSDTAENVRSRESFITHYFPNYASVPLFRTNIPESISE
jgi:hypothetical protein